MGGNVNQDCATRLAAAGLAVLPVSPKTRKPLVAWRSQSSRDRATVERWWRQYPAAVPALDLGKAGLVVLDGDRHSPGVDGVTALRLLLQTQPGLDAHTLPMVRTPRDGVHVYFRQTAPELSNARGNLPDGVDVRASGGFVLAPGAMLGDGRGHQPIAGQPELAVAFAANTIPELPPGIVALLKARVTRTGAKPHRQRPTSARERAYAKAALQKTAAVLAAAAPGSRNNELNRAAFTLGRMRARGWLTGDEIENALSAAMRLNGYEADKGEKAVAATIASGLRGGEANPHDDLPEHGIVLEDFVSHAPSRTYFFLPCREPWPGASVNSRLPRIAVTTADGEPKEVSPSAWLDLHRSVEQMTWCPGQPMLIPDRLFVAAGGWIERPGVTSLNHYRPPLLELGNAAEAAPWLDHVNRVYPDDCDHIVRWLAHRVQRPADKVNHALVLGGLQGIGKDTLLEPVKQAVGPWNVAEISPVALLGRFNGFLKSVILRVSEAHDLGEYDRFALYERLKAYAAAPPDGLRVDEKHLREYTVVNCCGIIITTNHRTDGIYLPADDRRHFVAWSALSKDDFVAGYWSRLWGWYDAGGLGHVAAYLSELDLTKFDAKAPPPKTAAFWDVVDAGAAPEDAELADVLDALGKPERPDTVTLAEIRQAASAEFDEWLNDRRNRRAIPHRMERCGYVRLRNDAVDDGQWKVKGKRQIVYVKAVLSASDRARIVKELRGY